MAQWNRNFKAPWGIPPVRPLSPPNAYVEPLSPSRPRPVEPSFNYPALETHSSFVQPLYNATVPNHNEHRGSHHRRTSSTIDTLAEAALGTITPLQNEWHRRGDLFETQNRAQSHGNRPPGSEPPHKRARSELIPASLADQYASRPATSYTTNAWQHENAYKSRMEEAALLLNFQSGGWPNGDRSRSDQQPQAAPPTYANGCSQESAPMRAPEASTRPSLLPPINLLTSRRHSTPHQGSRIGDDNSEGFLPASALNYTAVDIPRANGTDHTVGIKHEPSGMSSQALSAAMDRAEHFPAASNSAVKESAAAPKRRGWPKGKPRGSGVRKTATEKAASKRGARRRTGDNRSRKSKRATSIVQETEGPVRRKSISDVAVFGEAERQRSATPPARSISVPPEVAMVVHDITPPKQVRRRPPVNPDTICAGCGIARETTNLRAELDEWICCNGCKKWFHIDCAGFKKAHEIRDVDKYFCTTCEAEHGKTTYVRKSTRVHASVDYAELQRGVLKTSEESVEHHYIQPIKDGTFQFDPEYFPRMRPEMVTREHFEKSGAFTEPICIPAEWNPRPWAEARDWTVPTPQAGCDHIPAAPMPELFEYDTVPDEGQDRLDMVMPENLTIRQVCNLVGPDTPLDVIDVKTQNTGGKWTLGRWADYYEDKTEKKDIRNVISLEVSQTKLGRLLRRPKIVRDIDLQDDVWAQEDRDKGKWPKVQFYCLMSVADSYTDFHIDFGGSSVYYHILRGKKTFFFIPPRAKHLKAYEEWNDSPEQNYTFLPHKTKECYRVDLHEGDTMLIPSGWIHAVWTPEDSLVIGGNFLHRMAFKNQFKVAEIEKANETPMKFRYPFFQRIMWYTAIKYLKEDPLPASVSQLFHDGRQFQRSQAVWADLDGDTEDAAVEPSLRNTRYYSQAELDGLPDLVNFIFRTVMITLGRVEGVSQDRIKRVNASIPKGHGEPLEIAKTFALWVAWKRGNEDPPAWAHPDADLPVTSPIDNINGQPRKLSERRLRELERKEAIAAHRIAPDRQSARVASKAAAASAAAAVATTVPAAAAAGPASPTGDIPNPSQDFAHHHNHNHPHPLHHQQQQVALSVETAAQQGTDPSTAMSPWITLPLPGHHLSTPKTSVLGPKRVACDACRRRRIRCKHKDLVVQASPTGDDANGFHPAISPELQANGTAPHLVNSPVNFVHTVLDGQQPVSELIDQHHASDGHPNANGVSLQPDGPGRYPGTSAYVNANIPMAMNGVPIFGDTPKRPRSKACCECRKSKRRCVHDESGNIDPIKATETPVPRAFASGRKRQLGQDESSSHLEMKKLRPDDSAYDFQAQTKNHMNGLGLLKPQSGANGISQHMTAKKQQLPPPPQIDPSLFSTYQPSSNNPMQASNGHGHVVPTQDGSHGDEQVNGFQHFPKSVSDVGNGFEQATAGTEHVTNGYHPMQARQQLYQHPTGYELPSLEEIANEVLVDLNGNDQPNQHVDEQHDFGSSDVYGLSDDQPKPVGSVDSAVSMPAVSDANAEKADGLAAQESNGHSMEQKQSTPEIKPEQQAQEPPVHVPLENGNSGHLRKDATAGTTTTTNTKPGSDQGSPIAERKTVSDLPLYRPPAPPSQSPEAQRRTSVSSHNATRFKITSPVVSRKQRQDHDAKSSSTPKSKRGKATEIPANQTNGDSSDLGDAEQRSLELAKMLQQEDLGLRHRCK